MPVKMTRTLSIPEPVTQKKFYASSAYTSGGAQEEIYLPDTDYVGVSLVLVAAGTGRVELTTSTPDQAETGNPWPLTGSQAQSGMSPQARSLSSTGDGDSCISDQWTVANKRQVLR